MDEIKLLIEQIASLDIPDDKREGILKSIKSINKQHDKVAFQLHRTLLDKSISFNILNKTIEELEEQKGLVEKQSNTLEKNLEELARSYKELKQFSYIASHDLRSPLRTIHSFAQLLSKELNSNTDESAQLYLNFIQQGITQMDNIMNDLLAYSKVGSEEDQFDYIDLNEIMERVKFNLRVPIFENNASILHLSPLPTLKVKITSFILLFQNLISNAIKFRSSADPVIQINVKQLKEDLWEFIVCDNGVGIDEKFQAKAFLPFQRLNSNDIEGTGIGLAICKKTVLMHGGDIRYRSVKGKGTKFIFTIRQKKEVKKLPVSV